MVCELFRENRQNLEINNCWQTKRLPLGLVSFMYQPYHARDIVNEMRQIFQLTNYYCNANLKSVYGVQINILQTITLTLIENDELAVHYAFSKLHLNVEW